MNSPLNDLSAILKNVADASRQYDIRLKKNEAATRAVLIDPILRSLGWDIANPNLVEVEKTGSHGTKKFQADYALLADNAVKCIIEAECLGKSLAPERVQVVDYAFAFQVKSVFLTDGVVWEHYTEFDPTNLRPVWTANLHKDNHSQVGAYLVQYLDAALISPQEQVIEKINDDIEQLRLEIEELKQLKESVRKIEQHLNLNLSEPLNAPKTIQKSSETWRTLSEMIRVDATGSKPARIRFPNGEEKAVSSWSAASIETCRWFIESFSHLSMPISDAAGASVNLIDSTRRGDSKSINVKSKTYYVNTTYSSNANIRNLHYLCSLVNEQDRLAEPAVIIRS